MTKHSQIMNIVDPILKGAKFGDCEACAIKIRDGLTKAGFAVVYWSIKTSTHYIMLSHTPEAAAVSFNIEAPISVNGRHYGVEVEGMVFDNIFKKGLPLERWKNQFAVRALYKLNFESKTYLAQK